MFRIAVAICVAVIVAGSGAAFAAITFDPTSSQAGDPVSLTENSGLCTGNTCTWDFGDATTITTDGSTVTHTYTTEGTYSVTVSLASVPVDDGQITVTPPTSTSTTTTTPTFTTPEPPPPAATPTTRKLMSPFPRVRLAGSLTSKGAKITLLFVRAPRGATVKARCVKGCKKRKTARKVTKPRDVRLGRLYGYYRVGAIIRITVTKPGLIGKYTTFTIRKNRAPKRVDRCLWPNGKLPRKCPSK